MYFLDLLRIKLFCIQDLITLSISSNKLAPGGTYTLPGSAERHSTAMEAVPSIDHKRAILASLVRNNNSPPC